MMTKLAIASALVLTLIASAHLALADDITPSTYPGAQVVQVQSPDTRPCTFFQLKGVSQASPAKVSPWFSINQSAVGYKETVAMILMAQASGKNVMVGTTGVDAQCGEAQVNRVFVQ